MSSLDRFFGQRGRRECLYVTSRGVEFDLKEARRWCIATFHALLTRIDDLPETFPGDPR